MKKEVFIFLFITFTLIISGAIFTNNQPNVISLGCGAPTTPANNNGGNSNGGNSGGETSDGHKHPANAQGLVTDFSKPIDAKYKYENIPTINWKFIVDRAGLVLSIPDVTIQGQTVQRHVTQAAFTLTRYQSSTENCKYYYFSPPYPYLRKAQTFQYALNYKNIQTVDSVPHCVYDITQILNDIPAIVSLGGNPISGETASGLIQSVQGNTVNLADICAGFTDTSSPPNCAPTEQCLINVTLGESAFYGVKYDKDTAGNVIVLEDNQGFPIVRADAGQQISQADLNSAIATRAESFIADCSKKYEAKPQDNCGNGKIDASEECDFGNQNGILGSGCSKSCKNETLCNNETQFTCRPSDNIGAGWCCDKWFGECMPQGCGNSNGECNLGLVSPDTLKSTNWGIKWLDPNKGFPPECSCKETTTTLLIMGNTITFGENIPGYIGRELSTGYDISKYCELKKKYGDKCTFAITIPNFENFTEIINRLSEKNGVGKVKNLFVDTHGSSDGTSISDWKGDLYNALLCHSGKAELTSCHLGEIPQNSSLPVFIKEFCTPNSSAGVKVKISSTEVTTTTGPFSPERITELQREGVCNVNQPDCGEYCTAGNYRCYQCTDTGTAKEITCSDFS